MHPTRFQRLAAIATFLLASASFGAPGVVAVDIIVIEPGEPSCIATADGGASCDFSCLQNDKLYITASTTDNSFNTPEVSGTVTCAGISADCPVTTGTCTGDSGDERTPQSGDAHCEGESDEPWWSEDPFTVSCSAAAADGGSGSTLTMQFVGQALVQVTLSTSVAGVTVAEVYSVADGTLQVEQRG